MRPLSTLPNHALLAIRDQYLAPSLPAPFADDMARRLSRISTGRLPETSADTGTLTQAIVLAVPAGAATIVTDPSAEMVGNCRGTPLRMEIEARAPRDRDRVTRTATAALERCFGTEPTAASMRAHVVSASG